MGFSASVLVAPRYLNLLDTVNTATPHGHRLAKANLMLSAIDGAPVVLSQTQAFDSSVVIEAGTDRNGPAFRQLVIDRYIRVKLLPGVPSVLDAFDRALSRTIDPPGGDPAKAFAFSAWSIPNREAAADVRNAVRTGFDGALPSETRSALDTLRHLSALLVERELTEEVSPTFTLASRLVEARDGLPASNEFRDLGVLLDVVVKSGLNDRSALRVLIRNLVGPDTAKVALENLVNLCYNDVVSTSLQAKPTMLASDPLSVAAWAASDNGVATPVEFVETTAVRDLPDLTWEAFGVARERAGIGDARDRRDQLRRLVAEELVIDGAAIRLIKITREAGAIGAAALGGLIGSIVLPQEFVLGATLGSTIAGGATLVAGASVLRQLETRLEAQVESRLRGLAQES